MVEKMEKIPTVILSEEMISARNKAVWDTDNKNTAIVVRFGLPSIPFVPVNRIISTALKMQGYNDDQIFNIIECAEEDEDYDNIIKEAKAKFMGKYIKVTFKYPEGVEPSVSESYIERSLFEQLKKEGRVVE
ncbi:MAG: hypothetical protein ACP5L4_01955 [Thermoplasmata archaeon]